MCFYTIKALIATDGTETRDMRGFDNLDSAKIRYHSDLANAIGAATTKSLLVMIVNSSGGVHAQEVWSAPETSGTAE